MANEPDAPAPFSLRRWSQRKLEVARESAGAREGAANAPAVPSPPAPPPAGTVPVPMPAPANATPSPPTDAEPPLPPVDTLTIDSDFAPYLQPKVAEDVKRAALRKLFSDPQFNVMDGLDIYIGDYTQADPMPAGMLDKLGKVYGLIEKSELPQAADGALTTASAVVPPHAPAEDAGPATVDIAEAAADVEAIQREEDATSPATPTVVAPAAGASSR